jgi:hypothetical protein
MSAAYLLAMRVPPDTGKICLVEKALEQPTADVEMAKLLRAHYAPMNSYALYNAHEAGGLELVDALSHPPSSGTLRLKPVTAYFYVRNDIDGPGMHVCQSWPPAGMPAAMPAEAYTLNPDARHLVISLWHRIGVLRRHEAQQLRKYNWRRVRLLVQMRALALYWQGETQKWLCAPGGEGRAEDLSAYRVEFG